MRYPYSDEYMNYDCETKHYVLTEKDVIDNLGINIKERMNNDNSVRALLRQVSIQVYNYIHQFNTSNDFQDYVIAKTESGRTIIKEAMEQQLVYILVAGDLTRVPDVNQRALWFDEMAKQTLLKTITEIGCSICYSGRFPNSIPLDKEW
jgi:hypothetical protein